MLAAIVCVPVVAAARPETAAADAYASAVLADHPSIYYKLDENAGTTATDSSGHGLDGTYNGVTFGVAGPLVSEPSETGVSNGSVTQSGSSLPSGGAARTLEVWVDLTCCGGGFYVDYGDFSLSELRGITGVGLQVGGANGTSLTDNPAPIAGGWHLIDVVFSGGSSATATLYIDGQVAVSGPLTLSTVEPGNPLTIWGAGAPGIYGSSASSYAQAAVYPSALSAARIDAHWTAGGSPTGTPCAAEPTSAYSRAVLANMPVTYLPLDDLATTGQRVAYDSSGHCNNGAYGPRAQSVPGPIVGDPGTAASSGFVTQSGSSLPSGGAARTLEVWVDLTCCGGGFYVDYGDFSLSELRGITGVGLQVSGANGTSLTDNYSGPIVGAWHLIDVVFSGGSSATATLYIDGQVVVTGPLTLSTVEPGNPLTIWGDGAPGVYGSGVSGYAQAAVYPDALSGMCIAAHYAAAESSSAPCPNPPAVVTGQASNLMPTSGTLNGTVDPSGLAVTDCHFEYGTTTSYGSSVPCGQSLGTGSSPAPVSAPVTGLAMSTTYHFRLVAGNTSQTAMGDDQTFKTPTPGPPIVVTGNADPVSIGGATLNGTVTPEGAPITTCRSDYGIGAFTASVPCAQSLGAGFTAAPVSAVLSGLKGAATYQFRFVATNSYGTTVGQTETFQTCDATSVPARSLDISGCFTTGARGTYVSSGNVEVNGIEFSPHAGGQITIDPAAPVLRATGAGVVLLGGVVPVWAWATGSGFDVPLSGTVNLVNDTSANVFGFPVVGSVQASWGDGEATVTGTSSLRVLGDDISASLGVITDNRADGSAEIAGTSVAVGPANADPGVHELSSCSPSAPPPPGYSCESVTNAKGNTYWGYIANEPSIVHIGPLAVEDVSLSYDGHQHEWSGEGTVAIGDLLPGPEIVGKLLPTFGLGVQIGTQPFEFDGASASDSDLNLPIGPAVLTKLEFGLKLHPHFAISGDAGLTAAAGSIGIDGGFDFEQGTQPGFELTLHGTVSVKTVTISGFVTYDGRGGAEKVALGGSFSRSFGPVSATLALSGGVEPHHFELDGNGNVSAFGLSASGNGVLSDAGVGACASVNVLFFSGDIGFKHFWSGETDFDGCDFSGLETVGLGQATGAGLGRTVILRRGLPREEFAAVGASGPPAVRLTGPHGEQVSAPTIPDHITITKQGLALAVTSSRTTYFIVTHPAAGRWSLAPAPGAQTPIRYEVANPLRPLKLAAHVSGRGHRRTLSWRFAAQRGVSVRFIQRGGTEETIRTTSRGDGRTRFFVAPGAGGRRHMLALVSVDGIPRQTLTVASFSAQTPRLPRVFRARYRLEHGTLRIRWTRVRAANYYDINIRLAGGGAFEYRLSGRATSAKFAVGHRARVRSISVTVAVRGLAGRPITARHARTHKHARPR